MITRYAYVDINAGVIGGPRSGNRNEVLAGGIRSPGASNNELSRLRVKLRGVGLM